MFRKSLSAGLSVYTHLSCVDLAIDRRSLHRLTWLVSRRLLPALVAVSLNEANRDVLQLAVAKEQLRLFR